MGLVFLFAKSGVDEMILGKTWHPAFSAASAARSAVRRLTTRPRAFPDCSRDANQIGGTNERESSYGTAPVRLS
jgi:hypothetical protein